MTQLEKQLPGKAEMDALLSDINQAGLGRGLQFELFRPGQVVVKDYYAELPIAIKVTGRYHDIGAFAADIANLSRIVTLHNMTITTNAGSATNGTSGHGSDGTHVPLPRHQRNRGQPEGREQAGSQEMTTGNDVTGIVAAGAVPRSSRSCSQAAAPNRRNCPSGWSSRSARSSRTSSRCRRRRSSTRSRMSR